MNDSKTKDISRYCTAPWTGLIVRENGEVCTCCVGETVLGNVRNQSIIDIIESDKLINIKKDITAGVRNSNCNLCYHLEENSGTATLRNHFNLHHPDISEGLQYLDIRWNNLCNLYCVYCGPGPSSTWEDKLNPTNIKNIKNAYDAELEEWVLSKVDQIQELILIGGEPLLMKQNYSLVGKLPATARLAVLTNLSYNLENNPVAKLMLNRPEDNTLWGISVENYGDKFEYIRTGASWQQFKTNLEFLIDRAPNTITLHMTYGIFSGLNLLDTVKFYHNMGIKKIQLGMLLVNPALDIFNFPPVVMTIARNQLAGVIDWQKYTYGIDYDLYKCPDLETILAKIDEKLYSNTHQIISKSNFISEIEKYDQWTTRKFSDIWSEEYNLILQELHD